MKDLAIFQQFSTNLLGTTSQKSQTQETCMSLYVKGGATIPFPSSFCMPFEPILVKANVASIEEGCGTIITVPCFILLDKRARIQLIHSSKEVTRNVAQNLTVSYMDKCHRPSRVLSSISDAITQIEPNIPFDLRPLLPGDRRRRYEWIQTLKLGLEVPIIHVQYSPGSNIGDLHWIWQYTATNIDDALKNCQPIIEKLKKDIPEYHTQAMRRDAFELFGLVSPNTKKSVIRRLYKELPLKKDVEQLSRSLASSCLIREHGSN